jgi:hypothetical protein
MLKKTPEKIKKQNIANEIFLKVLLLGALETSTIG